MLKNIFVFEGHTCPWWFIGSFDNPLRRLLQPPEPILAGLVGEGQTVLDIGCGMGYFSLPLARMVGMNGRVIAADLQEKMLAGLKRRAIRAGLAGQITLHHSQPYRIGLNLPGMLDGALAFWMVHEVRDQPAFFNEIRCLLKPGAPFLVIEPRLHVPEAHFNRMVLAAEAQGFSARPGPAAFFSRSVIFE